MFGDAQVHEHPSHRDAVLNTEQVLPYCDVNNCTRPRISGVTRILTSCGTLLKNRNDYDLYKKKCFRLIMNRNVWLEDHETLTRGAIQLLKRDPRLSHHTEPWHLNGNIQGVFKVENDSNFPIFFALLAFKPREFCHLLLITVHCKQNMEWLCLFQYWNQIVKPKKWLITLWSEYKLIKPS